MGDYVQTDLTSLYSAGAVTLPQAANKFAKAAQELHKTGEAESNCFKSFGKGDGVSALSTAFSSLRNKAQDEVLCATANNLNKAGQALCQIASDYSEVDGQSKDNLDKYKEHLKDKKTPGAERPPDSQEDAPESTDPH